MDRNSALIVGEVEILPIYDAPWEFLPADLTPQVPPSAWSGYVDPAHSVDSRVLCFLLRSPGQLVLADCGVGASGSWRLGDGELIPALESLGVDREDIDVVLMTHLHLDHIGGAVRPGKSGPVANFPNARHLVVQDEWEYCRSLSELVEPPSPMVVAIRDVVPALDALGLIDIVESDHRVTEHISLLPTPGHTPGSTSIRVASDGEAALLIGDAAHHQAQLDHPDWSSVWDVDAVLAAESRRKIVAEAVRLGAKVAGAHFDLAAPVFAPMVAHDGGYRWGGVREAPSATTPAGLGRQGPEC